MSPTQGLTHVSRNILYEDPEKTFLTIRGFLFIMTTYTRAEVVELVDALRSGRSGSNPVGVRVPPSAPNNVKTGAKKDRRYCRLDMPGLAMDTLGRCLWMMKLPAAGTPSS